MARDVPQMFPSQVRRHDGSSAPVGGHRDLPACCQQRLPADGQLGTQGDEDDTVAGGRSRLIVQ